jgi:hypothetical protein
MVNLLHVSAFCDPRQESIQQRNIQMAADVTDVQ